MKNSQQAGMLCNEPLFRAFLKSRPEVRAYANGITGRPADDVDRWCFLRNKDDAAVAVRFLLDIDSRRELNEPPHNLHWREMVADYELWKTGNVE